MERMEVGQIVNTHGLRGELKINPWADDATVFEQLSTLYLKDTEQTLHIQAVRYHKNCAIVKAEGIDNINDAEPLKGQVVCADRDELGEPPEGAYYIADLLGLTVKTADRVLGRLSDVFSTGSNDVYVVKPEQGRDILLPVIPEVVREVNLDGGYVLVELMEGLVDE